MTTHRDYYQRILDDYIREQSGKMSGGGQIMSCDSKALGRGMFCKNSRTTLTQAISRIKRELSAENFKDGLISLPTQLLNEATSLQDSYVDAFSIQMELSLHWHLKTNVRGIRESSDGFRVTVEDQNRSFGDNQKMFVFVMENTLKPNETDCRHILYKYIDVIDADLMRSKDIQVISTFLQRLSTILSDHRGDAEKLTVDVIDNMFSNINKLLQDPLYNIFREVDLITDLLNFRKETSVSSAFYVETMQANLMQTLEECVLHLIVLDSMSKKVSPICSGKMIVQSVSDPVQKIDMRSSSSMPIAKCVYFLMKDDEAQLPYLFRVLLLNVRNQLYALPFSATPIGKTATQMLNIDVFDNKIKDKLSNSVFSSRQGARLNLYDTDSKTASNTIITNLHERLPYFKFWSKVAHDIFDVVRNPINADMVKHTDDVLPMILEYFNHVLIVCITHYAKNMLMNASAFTADLVMNKTTAILVALQCAYPESNSFSSEQGSLEGLLFDKNKNTLALVPNATSGLMFQEISNDRVDVVSRARKIVKDMRYDAFRKFYKLYSKNLVFITTHADQRFRSTSDDPLYDFLVDVLTRSRDVAKVFKDDVLSSREAIKKLSSFTREVSSLSTDKPSDALSRYNNLNLSADDRLKRILAYRA